MPFTAEAEITIPGPIDAVFAQFTDYRTWGEWMAPVLAPVRGPARPLRKGDRLLVRIENVLPSLLTVDRLEAPREVCWSGGVPGVVFARHTFYFDPAGEGATRIRSIEPWSGLLTGPKALAERLHRAAETAGKAQLAGFEKWYRERETARAA